MFTSVATLLAFSTAVYGVAFDGPLPTPVDDLLYANINGWSPKPTNEPRSLPDLFRRQQDEAVCGYIEGDSELSVSCTTGDCYYNTALSWFGCCTGTVVDSCNIATRCVASSAVDACLADSSCYNDPYILACTEASAPNCAEMYSVASQKTVSHLVCAPTATVVEILNTSTGGLGAASSIWLSSARVSASARATSSTTARSARPTSSATDEDDEESSAIVAATKSTTTGGQSARPSSAGPNAAASSSSTAGAAMQTAAAVVGAAGGLAGVIALLF